MLQVEVDEGEDDEGVLKRFRNQVMNTNILYEVFSGSYAQTRPIRSLIISKISQG